MAERFPSDDTARVVVRCGEALRDQLAERAKANGRSANSEAVMALEAWLGSDRLTHADVKHTNLLQVVLDTNGLPISWHEIHEHLLAITKDARLAISHMEVCVVTPQQVASDLREAEVDALTKGYRKLLRQTKTKV